MRVDDLPWLWAHTSDINTINIGGMPPGEHKVTIALVDPMHQDCRKVGAWVGPPGAWRVFLIVAKASADNRKGRYQRGKPRAKALARGFLLRFA